MISIVGRVVGIPSQATTLGTHKVSLLGAAAPKTPREREVVALRNRNVDLHFRLSEKEFDELEKKREKAGLTREAFIRAAILGAKIKAPPSLDFIKYHRELRRIGSNIDQVLRLENTKHFVDAPLLQRSLIELHETQKHLWDEFAKR